ncbi:aminotransferase-like domain-containing protein [Dyadobacter frigoris]|uniref:PLP-dependent aminotransferase family protein n=1 Tax=Dyadobacter frigoris TaxID=2576211 RepID=A0A4U6DC00_9BACT|nr:PLP-dependent aminotransferase family protein [Dyadobacter frigoris]TKT94335.1 PLP-dependent aminotransferase family protein [Dyadobacter frigoris]GLU56678.1 GntR family transcriptional regulator [Dyadobacter frigoris]
MIDFRFNYPVLDSQHILFQNALTSIEPNEAYLKMEISGGYPEDRKIASQWLSRPDYPVAPESVVLACGGHHALTAIILATGLSGGAILVDPVTYNGFIGLAAIMNVKLIPCPIDDKGMKPEAMAELCLSQKIKAVYLMPTIHNPLCFIMPLERRMEIVEVAQLFDLILIDDDAYGFLEPNTLPNFAQLAPERGFFIYSFAKILAPGVKTSYIIVPEKWLSPVMNVVRITSSGSVTLFTRLISNWVTSGEISRIIKEKQKIALERQNVAARVLAGYKIITQPTSFHFWIPLPGSVHVNEFGEDLSKKGIDVVTSSGYNVDADPMYNGIRVALGSVSDEKILTKGLSIIAESLDKA